MMGLETNLPMAQAIALYFLCLCGKKQTRLSFFYEKQL